MSIRHFFSDISPTGENIPFKKLVIAVPVEPISLKNELFSACSEEPMKINSRAYDENEPSNEERVERVNIYNIKQWAKANLPMKSHLRRILLLEENVLGVEEFLEMDLWLKLFELDRHNHQTHTK
jgi:hypothetical protein